MITWLFPGTVFFGGTGGTGGTAGSSQTFGGTDGWDWWDYSESLPIRGGSIARRMPVPPVPPGGTTSPHQNPV